MHCFKFKQKHQKLNAVHFLSKSYFYRFFKDYFYTILSAFRFGTALVCNKILKVRNSPFPHMCKHPSQKTHKFLTCNIFLHIKTEPNLISK